MISICVFDLETNYFEKKDNLDTGIQAIVDNVSTTKRGTTISSDTYEIHTVEHVLSAFPFLKSIVCY